MDDHEAIGLEANSENSRRGKGEPLCLKLAMGVLRNKEKMGRWQREKERRITARNILRQLGGFLALGLGVVLLVVVERIVH